MSVVQIADAFCWGEVGEQLAYAATDAFDGALRDHPAGLELGERLFDMVEVGRARPREDQRPCGTDAAANEAALVRAQAMMTMSSGTTNSILRPSRFPPLDRLYDAPAQI